jgi:lysophospholipase L1-like esterase
LESGETKTDWEEPWESAVDKIARFHKTSLELTWTSGKAFIYNAGWSNNSGWSYADVILTQGESIIVSLNVSTTVYPLSVWSDDGNSIIKVCFPIADSAAYKTLTYTCASDKERVRINVLSANKGNVVAVKYNVGDLLNKSNIEAGKNSIPCYDVLYDSIIAIGDSLTQGSYTGYDIHEQESYPAFLAKMMGVNVTNAGRAGWTTLEWFVGDSQTQKGFPYYDYSDYDTAVICLGTNGGFTDTVDDGATDTTNTGAYCSIIEGMRTQNPNINILLCNLWMSGGTGGAALANTVIGKIALKYGLTVIDLQSEFRTVYGAYHAVQGNIHLGRIGYAKMAQIIRNALEKQVMIDPTNYNYIPS